jgi:hypothetical protein
VVYTNQIPRGFVVKEGLDEANFFVAEVIVDARLFVDLTQITQ